MGNAIKKTSATSRRPKLSKYLFWDTNIKNLNFEERASFVLERVFTMGMQEDEWEAIRYYGKERIKEEVKKCKSLDKKTMNYLSVFYDIPKKDFACYMIEGIKVDFVHHPFELVEAVHHEGDVAYLGKKDIAAMKLHVIETNGSRAKDFIDIFFLLKEISLEEMFEYYRKKYSTDNIFNAKRSLGYFEDVPVDSWKEVRLVDRKVTASLVKKTITDAIRKFNDTQMDK
jgi:hypothetical protein